MLWTSTARAAECPPSEAQATSEAYAAGLAAYKKGQVEESYVQLHQVFESCPSDTRYRNDFLVVAVSSGHADQALQIAAGIDPASLPVYVLESLGMGARDTHQPDLAIAYYDTILRIQPDVGAEVGRDLARIDEGKATEARTDLQSLMTRFPDRLDVREALGLADEALGYNTEALAAAEAILERDPRHEGALQLRYRVLLRLGAPHLATGITPREILSNRERGQGLRDELAFEFRWARDEPSSEKVRAARLDAVILKMHAAQQDPGTDPEVRDGLRGDLVEALSERGRSREAVDGYQSMVSDGVVIQSYVTSAAVQAYEALKQPDEAVALYQALPPEPEPSYGVKASYFYALLESERYDAALSWADLIVGKEPIYEYASFPELRTENADYGRALVLAALARSYTDRPAEGQARLEAILDLAPADTDARLALAETYELRGWPRTAAATSDLLIAEDPESVSPLPQLFSDQLDDADWRGAYQTLTWMGTLLPPDDAQLLHAERDWDTHEMAEVIIDGQLGRSYGGGPAGVVDSEIGEYVYSSPIDWDYRAYLHLDQTEGQPVQGTTFRHAVGAGLEYHTTDWLATGELLEIDGSGPFPQFSVEATPDDYWKFGASYAVRTLDIPIAAVVVGVHADRLGLNLDYRVSESRDFGAEAVHEQFSDSNSRSELSGYWRERWITGPVYKLDTRVDVGTSENTLDDTNYFNPKRDLSATLTFENQWLQFRHYTTSLTHEVDVGFGDYYQQGYGQGSIALLRYQLVYEVNDRLTVRVGLGTTIRPFDGQREHLDVLSFYLDGRF